jgi:excisionase family DNA binding protein
VIILPSTSKAGQSHERARFLTVAEVAAQLRVSTMTVYRLLKAGPLASVRVGKSYRVREEDVDRYLASTYTQAG